MRPPAQPNTSPLAICIGEPSGIGPEIILKAWLERETASLPPFAVFGGAAHLIQLSETLGLYVPIKACEAEAVDATFGEALPVINLSNELPVRSRHGQPDSGDAALVTGSIITAVEAVMAGAFGGVVTAPINKKALYDAGFEYPGHTEFLAALASEKTEKNHRAVMMLAGPDLKTVPVTIHIPLNAVPNVLTSDLIVETCQIVAMDLTTRFGIKAPRLAVSGLNPHAGESGTMGKEDAAVIAPAVRTLQAGGINAFGPLPADTMFHASARQTYDAAICMYHDQALIPAKTLAFDEAVNVTLGLPFIRTSPDHGTALDIAGKGIANSSSLIAAIKMAGAMADNAQASREAKL